jgi:hypothetical protein
MPSRIGSARGAQEHKPWCIVHLIGKHGRVRTVQNNTLNMFGSCFAVFPRSRRSQSTISERTLLYCLPIQEDIGPLVLPHFSTREFSAAQRVTMPSLKPSRPMQREATRPGSSSMGPGQPSGWLTEEAFRQKVQPLLCKRPDFKDCRCSRRHLGLRIGYSEGQEAPTSATLGKVGKTRTCIMRCFFSTYRQRTCE